MAASASSLDSCSPSELPDLNAPWSISEASFEYISGLISARGYRSMVEFGSGNSTARWLLAFPELSVTSIEHDRRYFLETLRHLQELGLGNRVQLNHAPLRKFWFHGRRFHSYAQPALPESCDIVIIDGPPFHTRRGREACLYFIYNSLKVGGLVVLDDARREDEKATVANWLTVYPDSFSYSYEDVGNGLAVLTKIRQTRYHTCMPALVDFYSLTVRQVVFATKVRLKSAWHPKATGDPNIRE